MTQFLITALGSYGDVHPMAGLGAALVARGHRVKIITNPYFEDVVTGAGLELLPLGTREQYIELSRHPDLWHHLRGPKLVLSHASSRMLRPLHDLLMANYVPNETVFCAHAMDLASRVAAEKLAAPIASVIFAPGVMWSLHDSPRLKGTLLGPRVPRWLKRLQFWASDRLFVMPLLGPELNALRSELGLPRVQRIFYHWLFETDLMLGLFPDWFGPLQPDWPANTRAVGFPLWDSPDERPLSEDVLKFLAAGTPPLAFSPGSANNEAHQFFAAAVEVCERLGRRGILLTKYDHQLPQELAKHGAPLRLLADEQGAAAHGRAGSSRRHRQLCSRFGRRYSSHRAANVVRPIRQLRGGSNGWALPRKCRFRSFPARV